jgi:hypothetical protein
MKTCSKCSLGEDRVTFPQTGRVCHPCKAQARRERNALNPGPSRASAKRWREANPDKYRDAWLFKMYGLTLARYNQILNEQGGVCAGCGGPPTGKGVVRNIYYVDHDHTTGVVRGLLCHGCNLVLGYAKDRPEVLEKLADYLREPAVLKVVK